MKVWEKSFFKVYSTFRTNTGSTMANYSQISRSEVPDAWSLVFAELNKITYRTQHSTFKVLINTDI